MIRHGRTLRAADVIRAEQVRQSLRTALGALMTRYDVLAMATVPVEPFAADAVGPPGRPTPPPCNGWPGRPRPTPST